MAKDEVEGYKWLLLAAGQGDEFAKKGVTALERAMTKEQIAEGERRAGQLAAVRSPSLEEAG